MSLKSILDLFVELKDQLSLGFVVLIIFLSIIQVSKINWNPWDKILGWFGSKINSNLNKKIIELEKKFDEHIKESTDEKLENTRKDILDFCNACMNGRKHTQEQFRFIIKKCDNYESYIEEKNIKNGEISLAIEEIRNVYKMCIQKNSFLKTGEEFK